MSERFQFVLLMTIGLVAAVFLVAAMPTLFVWSVGGFAPHELFSSTSPDGHYRIDGIVRVDFPANEILDPSGTVRITLSDSKTGKSLDQLFVGIYEAGDFQKPTIVWQGDGRVQVQNLEGKDHGLSATLSVHAWDPR